VKKQKSKKGNTLKKTIKLKKTNIEDETIKQKGEETFKRLNSLSTHKTTLNNIVVSENNKNNISNQKQRKSKQ
jgi:hypothetical protein